ncbi:serine hydrolase domain-containing protein [Streptomyces sp. BI20]|uniref:serine hydrolase domain-containing protein n=1 Tax=Streptomyces sp. BI20 TaxID=3403460 RepID=UPI003C74FEA4
MHERPQSRPIAVSPGTARRFRRRGRSAVAAVLAGAALLGVAGTAPALAAAPSAPAAPSVAPGADAEVSARLAELVRVGKVPAALAAVRGPAGRDRSYAAGVADLATGAPAPAEGRVRIGSNTKTFVSVVVLKLVGEGRVRLDAPVERYLPGLLRGEGIDGRRITVRQLLQHTSGLPEYVDPADVLGDLTKGHTPEELLAKSLAKQAEFAPGTDWGYSNTNYLVAGMLVERVTGRSIGEEVTRRVIEPLRLRNTSFPRAEQFGIPGAHPKGYMKLDAGAPVDVTELNTTWAGAAGAMISTTADLNRFFSALVEGRVLAPALLREMRRTVPAAEIGPGAGYGLGLVSTPTSCGKTLWGHGGSIPGYGTEGGVTADGRAAHVAVTLRPGDDPVVTERAHALIDAAVCR